ncbi:MAG: hypothetical protein FWG40_00495 [Peptococcaceae bacterium]|nr:hypothetical protein [Peptococcaceae bacterium]
MESVSLDRLLKLRGTPEYDEKWQEFYDLLPPPDTEVYYETPEEAAARIQLIPVNGRG